MEVTSCPTSAWHRHGAAQARSFVLVLTVVLCACSSHEYSSGAPATSALLVTSVGSVNAVVNNGAVSDAIAFNSAESTPVTNLSVTTGLSSLPAGWSGPKNFSCASVSTGNGCVLNLVYAPTALSKGTLTLSYSYTGGTGTMETGTVTINYEATTDNNIVATPSVPGQIAAVIGTGSQPVAVTFTTDDGNPATSLSVTSDLTNLPAGWSADKSAFTCPSVSTGTACQLSLNFAPTSVGTGALSLAYTYIDDFGTAKNGTIQIPYAGTVHNNIGATAVPSPVYSAVGNGPVSIPVTFTTDDGYPATNLTVTSNLATLPAGWSAGGASFRCDRRNRHAAAFVRIRG
jgi:hypothetical protein